MRDGIEGGAGVGDGAGNETGNVIDPATIGSGGGKRRGGWPKGRPRKPVDGSASPGTAGAAPQAAPSDLSPETAGTVDWCMLVVTNFIAGRNEKLALDPGERELLSGSLKNALKYENIPMSERSKAWTTFAFACGSVYGAKIMAGALARDRPKPVVPEGLETRPILRAAE